MDWHGNRVSTAWPNLHPNEQPRCGNRLGMTEAPDHGNWQLITDDRYNPFPNVSLPKDQPMSFSQQARTLSVTTPLGEDILLLRSMRGREHLSTLFERVGRRLG